MTRRFIYTLIVITIAYLTFGFTIDGQINIPYPKIEKTIKKQFGNSSFELIPVSVENNFQSQTKVFTIDINNITSGFVYVSRINSCRAGGCTVNFTSERAEFEYFDYFLITDQNGVVLKVKVYNYQATHGQQVMSRGWLKQFIGFNGDQTLNYGSDIQAISGATISAKAITNDIQEAEKLIQKIIADN